MTPLPLTLAWVLAHLAPFAIVAALTAGLYRATGLNVAAAIAYATLLLAVPALQTGVLARAGFGHDRWRLRTTLGLVAATLLGLGVMSTIDLAGYDALATVAGMGAAGLALGVAQSAGRDGAPRFPEWAVATLVGWTVAAVAFRAVIVPLVAWAPALLGTRPFAPAYEGGHNELLWLSAGLLGSGVATAVVLAAARRAQPRS